ncbi:major capsid protein [Bartonella sp. WD12.1]|uniref:major capsid protein n=1 Tax=Bartonella sp. WD12.1 TaxID=1933903 RepID=UPI00099A9533|nr:major capsid protein [Bartonella sp. WD12.1]OPB30046.1 Phage major capsid protein E [Bartonella sp. WD12.1]
MNMDFFNQDAFSRVEMTKALENYEFKPGLIGSLNLFEEVKSTRKVVNIKRYKLSLIQTSQRSMPLREADRDVCRYFETTRIAKGYTISSEEIQNWFAFGTEDKLETAVKFIAKRQKKLIEEIELTWENMQLGAIQGVVLDADGSVLYDWYKEWEITPPEPIDFKLNEDTTDVADVVDQVVTNMVEASSGAFSDRSRIVGLCGYEFFSKLKNHKTVREIYLAQRLNSAKGISELGAIGFGFFDSFDFAGVTFINCRNIGNYNVDTKSNAERSIGIKPDECQFVPVNVPGVFQKTFAPGESWEFANRIGKSLYTMLIVDRERNAWVRPEVYSYPLFICTRPEMLFKAVVKAQ